ncbi:hypothetical protein C0Q70_20468 [Pomacea canaliculata]|uniref:Uncharacterized protein n=1 Tax=Pomacea canaliculata TaxID=400727 RepID=A0A2T7NFM4_POMCA|nr:hypothetical protein C0Q70_20468 [Pomacea canaliculata]
MLEKQAILRRLSYRLLNAQTEGSVNCSMPLRRHLTKRKPRALTDLFRTTDLSALVSGDLDVSTRWWFSDKRVVTHHEDLIQTSSVILDIIVELQEEAGERSAATKWPGRGFVPKVHLASSRRHEDAGEIRAGGSGRCAAAAVPPRAAAATTARRRDRGTSTRRPPPAWGQEGQGGQRDVERRHDGVMRNNPLLTGEMGRGVVLAPEEKARGTRR